MYSVTRDYTYGGFIKKNGETNRNITLIYLKRKNESSLNIKTRKRIYFRFRDIAGPFYSVATKFSNRYNPVKWDAYGNLISD